MPESLSNDLCAKEAKKYDTATARLRGGRIINSKPERSPVVTRDQLLTRIFHQSPNLFWETVRQRSAYLGLTGIGLSGQWLDD